MINKVINSRPLFLLVIALLASLSLLGAKEAGTKDSVSQYDGDNRLASLNAAECGRIGDWVVTVPRGFKSTSTSGVVGERKWQYYYPKEERNRAEPEILTIEVTRAGHERIQKYKQNRLSESMSLRQVQSNFGTCFEREWPQDQGKFYDQCEFYNRDGKVYISTLSRKRADRDQVNALAEKVITRNPASSTSSCKHFEMVDAN